ncbi:SDR family NAD(P)-dependent oxidoreductase [Labrys monachus]|uniref:NAD(P)-dependent dehydrogenase (Short-subunit alcohol dehydrogenase family) n=1 Tax=Labrys monachus TaxID=217067 RepID=A0ABU0FAX7_9HYPH|nr:SDR family NAD(P)-dependent oxidoreductase [Labrys monachus]MDQ0391274.1 NAD(P)-dependent dehydrogenase (short-subunit alcohol dehydrogenase family) [Labrys monachus]
MPLPLNIETYVVTGPTSGIGLCAARALSKQGRVVLVGRNHAKLEGVRTAIERQGGQALNVICDLADLESVRRAAAEIIALDLPIAGLLNNAGIMPLREAKTPAGLDLTFVTNYLGPIALTEALIPHLPDGANIAFVVSAIEDPERKPAKVMGMRGGRFISVEASARGKWLPGGARMAGVDAYATSKQCALAAAFALSRENQRLQINAVEPGINPTTGLGGANAIAQFLFGQIITRLPPFSQYRSTPERAGNIMTAVLTDRSNKTGVYYDEKGVPMTGSALAHDRQFQDRVLAETRAFLAETAA